MEFSKELIDKAKASKTAEELLALAKENEIELTKEDADVLLEEFREGELADEELDNVAGGQEGCKKRNAYETEYFRSKEEVQYIFNIGDIKQEFIAPIGSRTSTVKIIGRKAEITGDKWYDEYNTELISGREVRELADRSMFEK